MSLSQLQPIRGGGILPMPAEYVVPLEEYTNNYHGNQFMINTGFKYPGQSDQNGTYNQQFARATNGNITPGINVDDKNIDFRDPLSAVQELSLLHFGKDTLEPHSVTGKGTAKNKSGVQKPQLNSQELSAILRHVIEKFHDVKGATAKVINESGELVPLTLKLLRKAVMKKCYSCAKSRRGQKLNV